MNEEKIYIKANTVEEALRHADQYRAGFKFIAGGTDVIVNRFQGNESSDCLIDLSDIDELKNISEDGGSIKIGALVKLEDLKKSNLLADRYPALLQAAHEVASPVIRKSATLGGNILCENRCSFYNQSEWWREAVGYCLKCDGNVCIATGGTKACFSKFVSDTAPVLIALNATLEIVDEKGVHQIPLESIYTGDGIKPRDLKPNAILKNIILSKKHNYSVVFKKLRPREAVDFTSLTTAVSLDEKGNVRIAVGGVDPMPVVVDGNISDYEMLVSKVVKKSRIVDNDFYSRSYRKEMMNLFLKESYTELMRR